MKTDGQRIYEKNAQKNETRSNYIKAKIDKTYRKIANAAFVWENMRRKPHQR